MSDAANLTVRCKLCERDSETLRGVDHGDRDINRIIAEAKTKPDCVSDARWRIELRRRANRRYYDFCPI